MRGMAMKHHFLPFTKILEHYFQNDTKA
uniref:Uncharacterized protein n=1 Tax=Rhizophora mucronata TaxID=61149 RepID=A0A2P2J7P6_RHIMU